MPPSTGMFGLPFFRDGGKKDNPVVEAWEDSVDSSLPTCIVSCVGFISSLVSSLSESRLMPVCVRDASKTKPGPFPPPRTLSGAGMDGFFCFGAGSIVNKDDLPAPDSRRGLFEGGFSSFRSSSSSVLGVDEVGRLMIIFFAFRLVFTRDGGGFVDRTFVGGGTEDSFSLLFSLPLP